LTGGSEDPAEWIRLYRSGVTGAGVAVTCDVDNILDVLTVLAAARRDDPSVEVEHAAKRGPALAAEESAARQFILTPGWRRRIAELTGFVSAQGRMPRQKGGDEEETSLGRWLHAQRAKSSKGILEPRQRGALDAVGAWDSDRRERQQEVRIPARLQTLVDFRRSHRRLPSYRNRASEHESALGMWLHTLRQADVGGRLPCRVRDLLDTVVPGWNS
jgi:hypothetical protein